MRATTIRPAGVDDYAVFARLHPELATGDVVPSLERWTREIAPQTWIAEQDAVPAGFLYWQLLQDTAYVRQLVVAPNARRTGVGRALLVTLAEELRRRGVARWALNVKPDNVPAVALYESLGMRLAWESVALRLPWSTATRLGVGSDLRARILDPAEDALFEQAFGMPAGQLDHGRRARRFVVGAFDGGAPAGLALYDSSFPGAFPFHARSVAITRALLEQMHAVSPSGVEVIKLVIEGNAALAQVLLDSGATLDLRFVHLRGDVPA